VVSARGASVHCMNVRLRMSGKVLCGMGGISPIQTRAPAAARLHACMLLHAVVCLAPILQCKPSNSPRSLTPLCRCQQTAACLALRDHFDAFSQICKRSPSKGPHSTRRCRKEHAPRGVAVAATVGVKVGGEWGRGSACCAAQRRVPLPAPCPQHNDEQWK